tara:strand:+ start:38871 stop:39029 length:159 start_codon:yes stop_codon:yes gene_type:complete
VNKGSEAFIGPYIKASSSEEAKEIADYHKLELLGEVHELDYKLVSDESPVIH